MCRCDNQACKNQFLDLLRTSDKMLECQASACLRSEAIGETGMRECFTALRKAIRQAEKQLVKG